MTKRDSIPTWLIIADVIYVFCAIVAYNVVNTHFDNSQQLLTIILFLPTAIGTWGSAPIALLNLLIIGRNIKHNKIIMAEKLTNKSEKPAEITSTEQNESDNMTSQVSSKQGDTKMNIF